MSLKTKGPITSGRYTEGGKKWNWNFLLRLSMTGVGVYFVSLKIDFHEIALWIAEVPLIVIAGAILLFNVSKIAGAYRLNLFFRAESVLLSEIDNLKLYYIGMFYSLFLPGGIGGDAYKIYYLNKFYGSGLKAVFKPVLWDRISGAVAILFILSLLISFQPLLDEIPLVHPLSISIAVLILPAFYVVTVFISPAYKSIFSSTNILAIGLQIVQAWVAVILLLSMDIPLEAIPEYIIVFFVSSFVTIIPITIGGIGLRELVFVFASQYTAVQQNQAVAFSVIFFFITAISSFVGAFLNVPEKSIAV